MYIFRSLLAALDVVLICYFLSAVEMVYIIEYGHYRKECMQAAAIFFSFIATVFIRMVSGVLIASIMMKNIINWIDADKGIIVVYFARGVASFIVIAIFAAFLDNSCLDIMANNYYSLYVLLIIECILQISTILLMPFYICGKNKKNETKGEVEL
jgi:hypothetical protein